MKIGQEIFNQSCLIIYFYQKSIVAVSRYQIKISGEGMFTL